MKLEYRNVCLRPLRKDDSRVLYSLVEAHPEIWTYMTTSMKRQEDMDQWVEAALEGREKGTELPFVVVDRATDDVIGSTRLYGINDGTKSCELGHTWYIPSYQRTGVNTICKYLLLCYAFEEMEVNRVQLKAHSQNTRSIQAMRRIGALYEGTLRQERPMPDGTIRDAVVFSFIKPEWKVTKQHLETLLSH